MADTTPSPFLTIIPDEQHAALALREARVLMAPVVRWLLRHGVNYGAFAEMLKASFVAMAREELSRAGVRLTDSAVSVVSGVHRKDVRSLGDAPEQAPVPRCVPLASQLLELWAGDSRFRGPDGRPGALPRSGPGDSFEALAREISTDVHPRTLLSELLRFGLVVLEGNMVRMQERSSAAAPGIQQSTALFSIDAADHIAAAVHNLTQADPKFLVQSVTVDGLSSHSADQLHGVARSLWAEAFETMLAKARERVQVDAAIAADARMRFGVYYYSEAAPAGTRSGS